MTLSNPFSLAFSQHNHGVCRERLIEKATRLCTERNARLTRRRLQVLEILLDAHTPLGAYDLLTRISETEPGIKPPIIYRALDFLLEQGLAHRVESRNAFIACDRPDKPHEAGFLICTACEKVAEIEASDQVISSEAKQLDFKVLHSVVETEGLCSHCRHQDSKSDPK